MAVFVLLFLFLIISPVVESSVSLSRPCSHGLHNLPLVPSSHALWQHLIHQWVCYPAGLASIHSSGGSRRTLPVLCVWYREGINIYITHVGTEPHQMFSLHSLMLHCTVVSFSNNPGDNFYFKTYNYFKPQSEFLRHAQNFCLVRTQHFLPNTLGVWTECIFFLIKQKPVQHKHIPRYYLTVGSHHPMQSTNWQTNKQLSTTKYSKLVLQFLQHKVCSGPFFALMKHTDKVIKKPAINIYKFKFAFLTFMFGRLQCSCKYSNITSRSTNHCHRAIICLRRSHPIISPQISGDAY